MARADDPSKYREERRARAKMAAQRRKGRSASGASVRRAGWVWADCIDCPKQVVDTDPSETNESLVARAKAFERRHQTLGHVAVAADDLDELLRPPDTKNGAINQTPPLRTTRSRAQRLDTSSEPSPGAPASEVTRQERAPRAAPESPAMQDHDRLEQRPPVTADDDLADRPSMDGRPLDPLASGQRKKLSGAVVVLAAACFIILVLVATQMLAVRSESDNTAERLAAPAPAPINTTAPPATSLTPTSVTATTATATATATETTTTTTTTTTTMLSREPFDADALFIERFNALFDEPPYSPYLYDTVLDNCRRFEARSDVNVYEATAASDSSDLALVSLVCPDQVTRIVDLRIWAARGGEITSYDPNENPAATGSAEATASSALTGQSVTVIEVVDGDTINTSIGMIRIIGFDTPEVGEPCSAQATRKLEALLRSGVAMTQADPGQGETDRYDRLLRHVYPSDSVTPVGETMIRGDLAVARYDSQDGYGRHQHESVYRSISDGIRCWDEAERIPTAVDISPETTTTTRPFIAQPGSPRVPTDYNGPRCYEPGGVVWHPC